MDKLNFKHCLESRLPDMIDENTAYHVTDTKRLFIGERLNNLSGYVFFILEYN